MAESMRMNTEQHAGRQVPREHVEGGSNLAQLKKLSHDTTGLPPEASLGPEGPSQCQPGLCS